MNSWVTTFGNEVSFREREKGQDPASAAQRHLASSSHTPRRAAGEKTLRQVGRRPKSRPKFL